MYKIVRIACFGIWAYPIHARTLIIANEDYELKNLTAIDCFGMSSLRASISQYNNSGRTVEQFLYRIRVASLRQAFGLPRKLLDEGLGIYGTYIPNRKFDSIEFKYFAV